MPEVKVTGVTISTIWDDETKSDTEINCGTFEDTGDYVSIKEDSNQVFIRADEWGEVRDHIQSMFDSMATQK